MVDDSGEVTYIHVLKNRYFAVYNVTSFLSIFGSVLTSIALILLAFGDIGSIIHAICLYYIPLEEDSGDSGDGLSSVIDDIKASMHHLKERRTAVFLFASSFIMLASSRKIY